MEFRPFVGTVFVVEGPDGYRCLGARLTYGPDTDDMAPIVSWADSGVERFRYVAAPTPPVFDARAGTLSWRKGLGDWHVRPVNPGDEEWVYPVGSSRTSSTSGLMRRRAHMRPRAKLARTTAV